MDHHSGCGWTRFGFYDMNCGSSGSTTWVEIENGIPSAVERFRTVRLASTTLFQNGAGDPTPFQRPRNFCLRRPPCPTQDRFLEASYTRARHLWGKPLILVGLSPSPAQLAGAAKSVNVNQGERCVR